MSPTSAPTASSPAPSAPLTFPPPFAFGVATAAHQVEGNNIHSDWWDFEHEAGRIEDKTRSGPACEHYERFREDLQLIKDLHCTVYRFSIEWAKVEPEKGKFDQSVLDHYREVLSTCRSMGLEPLVTLYHFTLPRWFAQKGGWLHPASVQDFKEFTARVRDALGDLVRWWVTINEPMVYLYHAYLLGKWPPAQNSFPNMVKAARSLLRAHIEAYKLLHEKPGFEGAPPQVGIAKHLRIFDAHRDGHSLDRWAARRQEEAFNWAFLDSLEQGRYIFPLGVGESIPGAVPCQDYIGLNYYSRDRVKFAATAVANMFGVQLKTVGAALNDLGWELYSDGMLRLLRDLHQRYHKPLWITENGIADTVDSRRPAFVVSHLAKVAEALAEGIPVLGYCHWSLYDNFEWSEGFTPRFGLYAVDYETQKRTLRGGGEVYARIAASRKITPELLKEVGLEG